MKFPMSLSLVRCTTVDGRTASSVQRGAETEPTCHQPFGINRGLEARLVVMEPAPREYSIILCAPGPLWGT